MTVETQAASWLIVVCILAASFYFYSNHKYLTYVRTADTFEPFELHIPPKALSSVMENECNWPVLRPNDGNLDTSANRFRNIRCSPVVDPFASLDDFGFLEMSKPIIGGDLFVDTGVRCYYQPLVSNNVGRVIVGEAVEVRFNEATAIRHDQFVVKCHQDSSESVIYNKAFVNVPVATGPAMEPKFAESDPGRPSLALLVFDSVSLNHFKRNMPRTAKFLVDHDFFTFNMHNEMSDDANANVMNILRRGSNVAENGTTFLWDAMRDRNCMTYLSEEVGDFPSLLGNISLDVEHDLRPFYAYSRQTTKGYCTTDGRVASHEYLENWRNALLHSKERCHFSMHFMRTLSRGDSGYLSTLDTELRESLEILKANGMFENTIFVVMAGHGNRLKVRDELFTARVEERSPLFSIKLPEKFLRKHFMPKFWMDQNVNRLTTTNDVALTLRDIATMSFVGAKKMDEEEALLGASLLRIGHSYYRSCDDANIPPHLCLCMDEKSLLSEQFKKACNATRKALWAANACRNLTASAIKRLREIDKDSGRKARGIPERPPAIKSDTKEYQELFEFVRSEILLNDCLESVEESGLHPTLKVLSFNAMVQQGVKDEKDWNRIRKLHHGMDTHYVDIVVSVTPIPKSTDIKKTWFLARMRFQNTPSTGYEPIGTPMLIWANHKCFARRVEQYCEMCHYNRLST